MPEKPTYRVVVGMPAGSEVKTMFALDLQRFYRYVIKNQKDVELLNPLMASGSLIPMQRQLIVEAALKLEATHIMWIDTDMRFPATTLAGLLSRDKDIVGAGYPERRPPFKPTAFRSWNDMDLRAYTMEHSTGLEQVVALGGGMLLVRTDVYKEMPRPHYLVGWSNERGNYLGEDMYFAYRAGQTGFDTFLDHDLSKLIGHTGDFDFTWQNSMDYALANPDEVVYGPTETQVKEDRMPRVILDAYGNKLPDDNVAPAAAPLVTQATPEGADAV